MKPRKITVVLACLLLASSGCRKYLDINENPNVTQEVTSELLLPSAQVYIGSALGVDLQVNGSLWAQYWTQATTASQYKIYEQYFPTASEYDREWGLLYNQALADLRKLEEIAAGENQNQYVAISKLLQAYTYQLITDAWGDVPFSEALQGEPDRGGILNPRFDPQAQVYDGIITLINEGLSLIDPDDPIHPGSDDLIYGGDMTSWRELGNTLLLRVYLRISEVDPGKASAGIAPLFATPEFLSADAEIAYSSLAGNQNPLYAEIVGLGRTQNLVASATVIDSMNENNDPRRAFLYTTVAGNFVGLQQGNYNAPTTIQVSLPHPNTGAYGAAAAGELTSTATVKFMTVHESYFLQAEAVARGFAGGNDENLFQNGIEASFAGMGLDPADAADYMANSYWGIYPVSGSTEEKRRHISTQKWFSMTGTQGFEAWTEWRRTGYPEFFTYSVTSIIGNNFPQRFLYPNSELTRNASFPGQQLITSKVWWDVKD